MDDMRVWTRGLIDGKYKYKKRKKKKKKKKLCFFCFPWRDCGGISWV
jgi:hypothetical protein